MTERDARDLHDPTLTELGRRHFGEFSEAEKMLLDAAGTGLPAELGDASGDDGGPGGDLEHADRWSADRVIRAGLIRWLCVTKSLQEHVDTRGIQLVGARIDGDLDLSFSTIGFPFELRQCALGRLVVRHAHFVRLRLEGCRVDSIDAAVVSVDGQLSLRGVVAASVDLSGAHIGTTLDLTDARLAGRDGLALIAEGAVVGRTVRFRSARFGGMVNLVGAEIGHDLDCDGAELRGADVKDRPRSRGVALGAFRVTIQGSIYCRAKFKCLGRMDLARATVGNSVEFEGAELTHRYCDPLERVDSHGVALTAWGATIHGSFVFRDSSTADGTLNLVQACIGQNVECSGSRLSYAWPQSSRGSQSGTLALTAWGARIGGNVLMKQGFEAIGPVNFARAEIGRNLEIDSATFSASERPRSGLSRAFAAWGVNVKGSIFFRDGVKVDGMVELGAAVIEDSFECPGATFHGSHIRHRDGRTSRGPALTLENAKIGGSALFRRSAASAFSSLGELRLRGTEVGQDLEFDGCELIGPVHTWPDGRSEQGRALLAERITIKGGAVLKNGLRCQGEISFFAAEIGGNLILDDVTLRGGYAELPGNVHESRPALNVSIASIKGSLLLRSFTPPGFGAEGEVNLFGIKIGHTLELRGAKLLGGRERSAHGDSSQGRALFAAGIAVEGAVVFCRGVTSDGEMNFDQAHVHGDFDCRDTTLRGAAGSFTDGRLQVGPAFTAVGAQFDGSFSFGANTEVEGEVTLLNANVTNSLSFDGASIHGSETTYASGQRERGPAIRADAVRVGRSLTLRRSQAWGGVRLASAETSHHLDCSGAKLRVDRAAPGVPRGPALAADAIRVKGSAFLRQEFEADGDVRLVGAEITGDLEISDATFVGSDLILRGCRAGALRDARGSWPEARRLAIDGFLYNRIADGPTDARARTDWLRLQPQDAASGAFWPQPYQQMAKVLREQGHSAAARKVLIAMEEDRRRFGSMSVAERSWAAILKWTIGYGYQPLRVFPWFGAVLLLGWMIFGAAYRAGNLEPSDAAAMQSLESSAKLPPTYDSFCAVVYSFDTFVPVIDLGQKKAWKPTASQIHPPRARQSGIAAALCDGLSSLIPAYEALGGSTLAQIFRLAETISGWLLTTLFIAGVSGLVRRE